MTRLDHSLWASILEQEATSPKCFFLLPPKQEATSKHAGLTQLKHPTQTDQIRSDPPHLAGEPPPPPPPSMPPAIRSAATSTSSPFRRLRLLPLLLLLLLAFLLLSFPRSPPTHLPNPNPNRQSCDYAAGEWVLDAGGGGGSRYDHTCKEIFKGWNCIANGKANGHELLRWRWRPSGCELPRLDPVRFLERYRNTNIGFVGDSLNRNMFVSLVCMLRGVSGEVRKWRPGGADRGFTFIHYNLTLAYHRTNLLVRYGGQPGPMEVP